MRSPAPPLSPTWVDPPSANRARIYGSLPAVRALPGAHITVTSRESADEIIRRNNNGRHLPYVHQRRGQIDLGRGRPVEDGGVDQRPGRDQVPLWLPRSR